MEETTSCDGDRLFKLLRAFARRGAVLRAGPDGRGEIVQIDPRRPTEVVSAIEMRRFAEAGWGKPAGVDALVISKRGATYLRNHLNRPQSSCAGPPPPGAALPALNPIRRPLPVAPTVNLKESPLSWLRHRRDKDGRPMISAVEFDAGERLRVDFERGLMGPRVTSAWDSGSVSSGKVRGAPGAGLEMSEAVVAARQRVARALEAVGPEHSGMLLDVCCFLRGLEEAERNGGWPRRAGKVVLQLALAMLARHYGMGNARAGNGDSPAQIRVWHAFSEADAAGVGPE